MSIRPIWPDAANMVTVQGDRVSRAAATATATWERVAVTARRTVVRPRMSVFRAHVAAPPTSCRTRFAFMIITSVLTFGCLGRVRWVRLVWEGSVEHFRSPTPTPTPHPTLIRFQKEIYLTPSDATSVQIACRSALPDQFSTH